MLMSADESLSKMLEVIKNSIEHEKSRRYFDVGKGAEEILDGLTGGLFSACSVASQDGRYAEALKAYEEAKESLGPKYEPVFWAWDFLNDWADFSGHTEGQDSRRCIQEAEQVLASLKAGRRPHWTISMA